MSISTDARDHPRDRTEVDLAHSERSLGEARDVDGVVRIRISDLRAGHTPRQSGESAEHVRALAETQAVLPPILVQRPSMRVIDGAHRLQAAVARGQGEIDVQFFDGDDDAAFVVAVEANIAHGLPLSLADRNSAAHRIVRSHPTWSDRRIVTSTGLSPKTIAAIRRRSTEEIPQLTSRVGRDGRVRPVKPPLQRSGAHDNASESGVPLDRGVQNDSASPEPAAEPDEIGTAIARVMSRSPDATVPRSAPSSPRSPRSVEERASVVGMLGRDPSLRFSDPGRTLLRLLDMHNLAAAEWDRLVANVPAHCTARVADLARDYAAAWRHFAERLDAPD